MGAPATGPGGEGARPDIDEVLRREVMLLDPVVRSSPEQVLSLLHPEFVEFGSSGHRYDAHGVAAALEAEALEREVAAGEDPVRQAHGLAADHLAADVVLVTYETHRTGRVTRRSSVWVRHSGEWRLRFHQGTVAAPT
jgi:hypothetical protein